MYRNIFTQKNPFSTYKHFLKKRSWRIRLLTHDWDTKKDLSWVIKTIAWSLNVLCPEGSVSWPDVLRPFTGSAMMELLHLPLLKLFRLSKLPFYMVQPYSSRNLTLPESPRPTTCLVTSNDLNTRIVQRLVTIYPYIIRDGTDLGFLSHLWVTP